MPLSTIVGFGMAGLDHATLDRLVDALPDR
jgi:hypothetical protein